MFQYLRSFCVTETDPSDEHCILSCSFSSCTPDVTNRMSENNFQPTDKKWNDRLLQNFPDNIDRNAVDSILNMLELAAPNRENINEVASRISVIFENASDKTFPMQSKRR